MKALMSPQFNCRTYIISHPEDIDAMMKDIVRDGDIINGTREFVNTRLIILDVEGLNWGLDYTQTLYVEQLLKAIREQDDDMVNEVYDSKYYTFLKEQIASVKRQFQSDCVATRRAVFSFPASHCFESIQILVRGYEAIITVNMRSCNAHKNLLCDLYLAYKLACEALYKLEPKIYKSIVAHIGSLHIFKEDINHVL